MLHNESVLRLEKSHIPELLETGRVEKTDG